MLNLSDNHSTFQIRAYQPGIIQVNDNQYTHSLIITATSLKTDWRPQFIHELTASDLAPILALKPAILLIGTGSELVFPPLEVYGDLINQGIGVEIMTTQAACRTFTALTSEDRNVAAGLIIK